MNNILKGTIAAGAGVALLLGGAGTFALWNASASTAGGTIVAGDLSITPVAEAPSWTVNGGSPLSNLDGYPLVPGDVVTYSTDMTITATGDNLVATLDIDPASISPTSATAPADVALADYLTANAVLDATGTGISAGPAPYTVTAGADGVSEVVSVDVTITFPKSTTAGFENDTKLGSVDLDELAVTLTQN
ncbi:alternate-type signal peptide domain-containing protein [Microbacterium sp. MM2322]|uniref:alternate-type signal peptide domain-containing protein n=1 Tax=Microbacterium sp. MM2322 TaxID=3157631 RepID=UPI0032D592E3